VPEPVLSSIVPETVEHAEQGQQVLKSLKMDPNALSDEDCLMIMRLAGLVRSSRLPHTM
jgi:hypothetical protein